MPTADEIPACTCDEAHPGNNQTVYVGVGVACERHPNASFNRHIPRPLPPSKPTKGNAPGSLANLNHWHEVHAEERSRRRHIRDDEEPEPKYWRQR